MHFSKKIEKVAGDIVELIAKKLSDNRAIHPGTAILSCARLSGSFLFRSFGFHDSGMTSGDLLLSDQANQNGLRLIDLLNRKLYDMGIIVDFKKLEDYTKTTSNLNFLETLNLLQTPAFQIMTQNNLHFEHMATASTLATAFIIKECKDDLPVESGLQTAIYGITEGSKTCPPDYSISTIPSKPDTDHCT